MHTDDKYSFHRMENACIDTTCVNTVNTDSTHAAEDAMCMAICYLLYALVGELMSESARLFAEAFGPLHRVCPR